MSEVPAEEYREYILKLLKLAKEAMEKRRPLFENRLKQVEYYIELIESGKYLPKVYEVEPGHKIYWHEKEEFAPYTLILEDRVLHRQGRIEWGSDRIHRKDGFHIIGRPAGRDAGYIVIKTTGDLAKAQGAESRVLAWEDLLASRFHGILAPHPKEEGKFVYIHFGRNPPKIVKEESLKPRKPRERK